MLDFSGNLLYRISMILGLFRRNPHSLEETIEEFRIWVEKRSWTFARTMWWCPHYYTVVQKDAHRVERAEFERWVQFIRDHGVAEKFNKARYVKFSIDGWKYWSMGWPIPRTILINRCQLDAPVLPKPPPPEMTLLTPKLRPSRRSVGKESIMLENAKLLVDVLENAKRHPKHGYHIISKEIALALTPEQVAALCPAQKGYVHRVRAHALETPIAPAPVEPAKPKKPAKKPAKKAAKGR